MQSPETQADILSRYFGKKQSIRAIARELRINRKTVAAVIHKREVRLVPTLSKRPSFLDFYKDEMKRLLEYEPGIYGSTIFQRIREKGYAGSYTTVKKWQRKNRTIPHRSREAFLSLEFYAGECAQVDWGEFGDVFADLD